MGLVSNVKYTFTDLFLSVCITYDMYTAYDIKYTLQSNVYDNVTDYIT